MSIDTLRTHNLVVEAVPGAGKTRLLRQICDDWSESCLLLAYNAQLAREINTSLDERHVCSTFHALCGKHLAPACDDVQMEQAIQRLEKGELVVRDKPTFSCILIDEAQDVRELYVKLLHAIGLIDDEVRLVVAGDRNQLVYDFDPDFPACLDTLLHPEKAFKTERPWKREVLSASHRLTVPMAGLVNATFGTSIQASKKGSSVEVRCPASMFKLDAVLRDVWDDHPMILVDRMAGNRPLRALLNVLSCEGRTIVMQNETCVENAIRCTTYWSAKGLEANTVVLLLPAAAPRNPTYVALTRARQRLIVVLDPKAPHPALCDSMRHVDHVMLRGDRATKAICVGLQSAPDSSWTRDESWMNRWSATRSVDRLVPSRKQLKDAGAEVEASDVTEQRLLDVAVPTSRAVVMLVLVTCEARKTGRVKAFESILTPARMSPAQRDEAILNGFSSRSVPPYMSDDDLLASDLHSEAEAAYAALCHDPMDREAAATVALALLAWNDFDHVMRGMRDVASWCHDEMVTDALAWADKALRPAADEYDMLLKAKDATDSLAYARAHAVSEYAALHVCWVASSADVGHAAVRAALHPSRECVVIELGPASSKRVRVDGALF